MEKVILQKINQEFVTTLNGNQYSITVINRNNWYLDIKDINGNKLISGILLVQKNNLLEQYQHLEFNCKLYCEITDDNIVLFITNG